MRLGGNGGLHGETLTQEVALDWSRVTGCWWCGEQKQQKGAFCRKLGRQQACGRPLQARVFGPGELDSGTARAGVCVTWNPGRTAEGAGERLFSSGRGQAQLMSESRGRNCGVAVPASHSPSDLIRSSSGLQLLHALHFAPT